MDAAYAGIAEIDDLWLSLPLRFEAINEYRFIYREHALVRNGEQGRAAA